MKTLIDTTKALCSLNGTPGDEGRVAEYICEQLKDCAEVNVDRLGNVIAFKKGTAHGGKSLMLAAHMDEVGFIIRDITEEGYLKFASVGGIDTRVAVSKKVAVGDKGILGVIGCKPIHIESAENKDNAPEMDTLRIDIGAKSREEALEHVQIGDRATFVSECVEFGEESLKAKALDDRAGCAILLELCKNEAFQNDTYFVFTTREEVGSSGAQTATFTVSPDYAIVVDVTTASDIPSITKEVCKQKEGPVLSFMDGGTVYDPALFRFALQTAKDHGIPAQIKTYPSGGTDAAQVHRAVGGVRTVGVSLAGRGIHSGASVLSKADMEAGYKLIRVLIDALRA